MKKLTISVAAYNVSKYIRQNLDSIVNSKYVDQIEVLVVDDGSPDDTLEIAREYHKKYPTSVIPVHKENGGYGSTVNYSIRHASGEYFRLLDGDDHLDTAGLDKMLEFLQSNSPDWIVTNTHRFIDEGAGVVDKEPVWYQFGTGIMNVEDVPATFQVGMWESTYKTEIFREHFYDYPLKTLYTDCLYATYCLPYVKTVAFLPYDLYCYRLGRDGQSVSRESRIKHCDEMIRVVDLIKNYYYEKNVAAAAPIVKRRFTAYYKWQILNIMLLPASRENKKRIVEIERFTRENMREFYDAAALSKNISLLRLTNYLAYWPLVWHGVKSF